MSGPLLFVILLKYTNPLPVSKYHDTHKTCSQDTHHRASLEQFPTGNMPAAYGNSVWHIAYRHNYCCCIFILKISARTIGTAQWPQHEQQLSVKNAKTKAGEPLASNQYGQHMVLCEALPVKPTVIGLPT